MKYATTSEKVKQLDRKAVEEWGIASPVLMENAGRSAVELIEEELSPLPNRILVISGKGNNGGDGLVVARRLLDQGHQVEVFVLGERSALSPGTERNAEILERMTEKVRYCQPDYEGLIREIDSNPPLLVDAIFGVGIEGELRGKYPQLISRINESEGRKVSIDLPSGLLANSGVPAGKAVKADLTVTMEPYKLGSLLPEAQRFTGKQRLASVGYPRRLIEEVPGIWKVLDDELAKLLLPDRPTRGHKGSFGKMMVVGGSAGMTGAPILATESGLRSGAGLVFLAGPESVNEIFATHIKEALTVPLPDEDGAMCSSSLGPLLEAATDKDALAVGPGLGRKEVTRETVRALLARFSGPIVLDADGIVALADDIECLKGLEDVVLTPHPGELAYLLDTTPEKVNDERYDLVPELAQTWEVTILLKGIPTVISSPTGELALANCPNTGLAKGGSGDILTGIIGSFLAQGLSPFSAARLAAWIHCRIGELGAKKWGVDSLQPGDLPDLIGSVLMKWRANKEWGP